MQNKILDVSNLAKKTCHNIISYLFLFFSLEEYSIVTQKSA